MLQCVAVRCSVMQRDAVRVGALGVVLQCVAVCCGVLGGGWATGW